MSSVPPTVADEEPLHRRIHPTFQRPDGTISSAAFTDPEMSVDRGHYRSIEESLENYGTFGLAVLLASAARQLGQTVVADPDLLNPAHALVRGHKSRSVARSLARASAWMVKI